MKIGWAPTLVDQRLSRMTIGTYRSHKTPRHSLHVTQKKVGSSFTTLKELPTLSFYSVRTYSVHGQWSTLHVIGFAKGIIPFARRRQKNATPQPSSFPMKEHAFSVMLLHRYFRENPQRHTATSPRRIANDRCDQSTSIVAIGEKWTSGRFFNTRA